MSMSKIATRTFAILTAIMIAACSGDPKSDRFMEFQWPGQKKDEPPPIVVSMAGRWMLSSANRGQCGMNFSGATKATEGAIAPEGGCPGNFFTSRSWALEENKVIIRDHKGEQLAILMPVGTGRWFEGQTSSGERVMLARQ
jgi:Protease inhibitor Inh